MGNSGKQLGSGKSSVQGGKISRSSRKSGIGEFLPSRQDPNTENDKERVPLKNGEA